MSQVFFFYFLGVPCPQLAQEHLGSASTSFSIFSFLGTSTAAPSPHYLLRDNIIIIVVNKNLCEVFPQFCCTPAFPSQEKD